jgi:hypothetical protein
MTPLVYAPQITYSSRDFPKGLVSQYGNLTTSWAELLWAAITIGRPNTAFVFQHGDASLHEAVFRLSLIRMALEQRPYSRYFQRTDAFRALDPTEKGAVSYFLGMAVCKLFASHLLKTPWLLHLDVFRDQLNPATLGGRSRPDLVGEDRTGAWHAFETKGRSTQPSSEDKKKAKAQAQRLVSVDGTACTLHIGSFAFFRQDDLEFYWRDPEPEEPEKLEPIEINVRPEDWESYYRYAVAINQTASDEAFSDINQAIDLKVEIHPKVRGLLLGRRWSEARALLREIQRAIEADGFHPDGLRVVVGDTWGDISKFTRRQS